MPVLKLVCAVYENKISFYYFFFLDFEFPYFFNGFYFSFPPMNSDYKAPGSWYDTMRMRFLAFYNKD